jgi:hypothetical protein
MVDPNPFRTPIQPGETMHHLQRVLAVATLVVGLSIASEALQAQVSRADSAAVLLDAARNLQADGHNSLARQLLVYIVGRYGETPAAATALEWLQVTRAESDRNSGQAGLIVWNTLYGAWLGVAIPAAFGADSPGPYGAGLLIGAPLGFFGTKAFTTRNPVSSGQAIATSFGSIWGTWQGVGWRAVLDIGSKTYTDCWDTGLGTTECFTYEDTPEEAGFTAAVVGGLAGLATGGAVALAKDPTAGDATLVMFGSFWGTWYGLAAGVLAGAEDDALLTWTLVGGDVGLLGSALGTKAWTGTAGRTWLVSASGLAGGLAGLGLDLLMEIDDEKTAVLIPSLTSAVGLVVGLAVTDNQPDGLGSFDPSAGAALVNLSGGDWRLGMPLPRPTVLKYYEQGRSRTKLGFHVPLLSGRF